MHAVAVPRRPSETSWAQAWLENFAGEQERAAAALLVDSLHIVDTSTMTMGLRTTLSDLADRLNGPTMLLPVLSQDELGASGSATSSPGRRRHVAWRTFAPGGPIPSTPGSEGLLGTVLRDLVGEDPTRPQPPWLHPATDLDTLRDARCRELVLVADYSGSGSQIITFAKSLVRNERIRSWRSFKWTRLVVVAYAMSLDAHRAIERSGLFALGDVHVVTPAASLADAQWSDSERAAVERLCLGYGDGRSDALGFGGSGGLFLTHDFVPNNLPWILRRQRGGWRPFFVGPKGRTLPPDLAAELGSYIAPDRDLAALAEGTKQARLAKALESGRIRSPADRLVVVLALLASRTLDVAALSHQLARGESEIEAMLAWLRAAGFVDGDMKVTRDGRAELAHARRLDRVVTAGLSGTDAPYYPSALR